MGRRRGCRPEHPARGVLEMSSHMTGSYYQVMAAEGSTIARAVATPAQLRAMRVLLRDPSGFDPKVIPTWECESVEPSHWPWTLDGTCLLSSVARDVLDSGTAANDAI